MPKRQIKIACIQNKKYQHTKSSKIEFYRRKNNEIYSFYLFTILNKYIIIFKCNLKKNYCVYFFNRMFSLLLLLYLNCQKHICSMHCSKSYTDCIFYPKFKQITANITECYCLWSGNSFGCPIENLPKKKTRVLVCVYV